MGMYSIPVLAFFLWPMPEWIRMAPNSSSLLLLLREYFLVLRLERIMRFPYPGNCYEQCVLTGCVVGLMDVTSFSEKSLKAWTSSPRSKMSRREALTARPRMSRSPRAASLKSQQKVSTRSFKPFAFSSLMIKIYTPLWAQDQNFLPLLSIRDMNQERLGHVKECADTSRRG